MVHYSKCSCGGPDWWWWETIESNHGWFQRGDIQQTLRQDISISSGCSTSTPSHQGHGTGHCESGTSSSRWVFDDSLHESDLSLLLLWSALFLDFTQHRMVIPYQHFGTTYHSHNQGSLSPNFLDCLTLEGATYRLSWNVIAELPFYAVKDPKKVQISFT